MGVVTFVAQTFMALRVYAMSGQNKVILCSLATFNIIQGIFIMVLIVLPGNKGAYHVCEQPWSCVSYLAQKVCQFQIFTPRRFTVSLTHLHSMLMNENFHSM